MKKIIFLVCLVLVAAACQQKEEPKPRYEFPSGPVQGGQGGPIQGQDDTKLLREVVSKDPKNLDAWIKLGNVLMDTNRYQEAVEAYGKALELDPRNVNVRVDMGTCYKNSGRPEIAVREYKKALELDPNHLNAHRNLAVVMADDMKDKAQAVREFEKYLQLAPNAADAPQIRQLVQQLKGGK